MFHPDLKVDLLIRNSLFIMILMINIINTHKLHSTESKHILMEKYYNKYNLVEFKKNKLHNQINIDLRRCQHLMPFSDLMLYTSYISLFLGFFYFSCENYIYDLFFFKILFDLN